MNAPQRRTPDQARALLDAELARLEPRRAALGDAGICSVAGWTLDHGYEFEASLLAWRAAAALAPDDPEPLYRAGVALLELGDWSAAAETFRAVIALDERLVAAGRDGVEWMEDDPAYRLGMSLHAAGDLRAALEAYEASARRNTTGVDALREAARCRVALEEPEAALETIARLELRAVRLTLRAELMAIRSDAQRLLRERGS